MLKTFVLVLAGALAASGATIYNLNNSVGAGSISGAIQTDGIIGVLGTSNILDWNLVLNDIAFLTHAGGLWRDEVNTINLASRRSLGEIANDSFPIFMPLMVRVWSAMGLGESDMELRLLGVIIGLGILAALWVAALREVVRHLG